MKIKLNDKIFNYRFASKKDIDTINRFDIKINKDKEDKRYYLKHDKKKLSRNISNGNKIYLVFYNNKLVAWATVFTTIKEKYYPNWCLNSKTSKYAGILAATAVSKEFRGYGIQRFLIKKRLEYLKKKGKKYAYVGAVIGNKYSHNN